MKIQLTIAIFLLILISASMAAAQQAQAKTPIVPEADGFVVLPKAAVQIDKRHVYRAIWNATSDADGPKELVPALNMLGSELNAFAVSGVPLSNAKFLIVFHGPSVNGLYDDANYKAKFGVPNPNLKVLSELRKAGVEIYV
jgi:hypothetical protein